MTYRFIGMCFGVCLTVAFGVGVCVGADDRLPGEQEQGEQQAESLPKLPKPLDGISGNYKELEKDGYFRIEKMEFGRTREFNEEALVWTLTVVKPLAGRHAMLLLDELGDVRFYRINKEWRKQLQTTLLYYPAWIASRSANGKSLNRDEQFEVWIPLDEAQIQRLHIDKAEIVEFRPVKR